MASASEFVEQGIYHIRVQGTLDRKWEDWFDGFVIAPQANGETGLTGPVTDQAALHGMLGKVRDLGLPLVLVARAECPCPKRNCPRRAQCLECEAYHAAKGKLPFCLRPRTKWQKRLEAFS